MGSRLYKFSRDDRVPVGQDVLRGNARDIAINQLIPRIAVENQIAVETVQAPFFFYRKIPTGSSRQCSCFNVEVSPNSTCYCCFGTGTVGGYEKYGTNLEVFDVTHPSLRAMNVMADYGRRTRPRQFVLIPGARKGYVISRMHTQTNIGTVDHILPLSNIPGGADIDASVRGPTDAEWVRLTRQSIEQRLFNPWLDIRVELSRSSVLGESPRFGMLFLRYNRLVNQQLIANIPRTPKSGRLQEFGITDDWQTQRFWVDNTLRAISSEDWVAHVNGGTRWKILDVNDFAPEGQLLSWEFNTRLIQIDDPQNFYPL